MSHKLDFLPSTADENQFFEDCRSHLAILRIFHKEIFEIVCERYQLKTEVCQIEECACAACTN